MLDKDVAELSARRERIMLDRSVELFPKLLDPVLEPLPEFEFEAETEPEPWDIEAEDEGGTHARLLPLPETLPLVLFPPPLPELLPPTGPPTESSAEFSTEGPLLFEEPGDPVLCAAGTADMNTALVRESGQHSLVCV